jgi:signal transduction histidine kinase
VARAFAGVAPRDIAIALAVAVVGQQEVWLPAQHFSNEVGPRPLVALLYVVTSLALLWRRVAPLTVLVFICAVQGTQFLLLGAPEGLATFLPGLVAYYAVGRYCDTRAFAVGTLATVAATVAHEWRDPIYAFTGSEVVLWSVLLGSGFLGLAFRAAATESEQLAERARAVEAESARRELAAAAAERDRITADMHDIVGHSVSLMVLQLVAAQATLDAGAVPETRARLESLEATARTTMAEMRRLVQVRGVDDLTPQPGLADLPALVDGVRDSGVAVDLTMTADAPAVAPGLGLAVYRLVQEALTNVVKHARPPDGASVTVASTGDALTVEVSDRGRAATAAHPWGRGMVGMRERVAAYGGTFTAGPRTDGGFRVAARFPLTADVP